MITMPLMQKNGTVTLWQVINKKSQELSPKWTHHWIEM
jgi:hypothetical protein